MVPALTRSYFVSLGLTWSRVVNFISDDTCSFRVGEEERPSPKVFFLRSPRPSPKVFREEKRPSPQGKRENPMPKESRGKASVPKRQEA